MLFLPRRNETFHPVAEVILRGKSLQAVIRYKCWLCLSGYHLFYHRSLSGQRAVKSIVVLAPVMSDYQTSCVRVSLTFYTLFDLTLKVVFDRYRKQSDSFSAFHSKVSASTQKAATKLSSQCDSGADFSQQPEPKAFFPPTTPQHII